MVDTKLAISLKASLTAFAGIVGVGCVVGYAAVTDPLPVETAKFLAFMLATFSGLSFVGTMVAIICTASAILSQIKAPKDQLK